MNRQIEIIKTLITGETEVICTLDQADMPLDLFEIWAGQLREMYFSMRSHDDEKVHWSYCEGTHHDTTD